MAKIGIDLGGTRIKVARVEADQIQRELSVDTPTGGPAAVLGAVAETVRQLDPKPVAVGFAIPGEVDAQGNCYRLPNIAGFENVNIESILGPLLGCPICVENDGNAAAHGEALFGLGKQYPSFAMITLGTGIGGGLVIDGRVRTGAHGFAAEIGHIPVVSGDGAWQCGCGQRGCVEAYAGTFGLLRKFHELGGSATEIVTVAESARRGETPGVEAFRMLGEALAQCVTILENLLDLDAIVFTGGISQSFDLFEPVMRAAVRKRAFAKPLAEVPLLISSLGARAGAIGAAHLDTLRRR
jgi:glucokinase